MCVFVYFWVYMCVRRFVGVCACVCVCVRICVDPNGRFASSGDVRVTTFESMCERVCVFRCVCVCV